MAQRHAPARTRSRSKTSDSGSRLAAAADVAYREFRDDDPDRTREVMLHLWWNSGFSERRFCDLLQEARAITKARIAAGQVRLGEPGRRRAMPYLLAILRELLVQDAGARR
jgi:hypothetical protein